MDLLETINEKLDQLTALQSEAITVNGLTTLTGWSKTDIYKKTSKGILPYYKPNGKTIFFKKSEIEAFLLSNRQKTLKEIQREASNYVHINQ